MMRTNIPNIFFLAKLLYFSHSSSNRFLGIAFSALIIGLLARELWDFPYVMSVAVPLIVVAIFLQLLVSSSIAVSFMTGRQYSLLMEMRKQLFIQLSLYIAIIGFVVSAVLFFQKNIWVPNTTLWLALLIVSLSVYGICLLSAAVMGRFGGYFVVPAVVYVLFQPFIYANTVALILLNLLVHVSFYLWLMKSRPETFQRSPFLADEEELLNDQYKGRSFNISYGKPRELVDGFLLSTQAVDLAQAKVVVFVLSFLCLAIGGFAYFTDQLSQLLEQTKGQVGLQAGFLINIFTIGNCYVSLIRIGLFRSWLYVPVGRAGLLFYLEKKLLLNYLPNLLAVLLFFFALNILASGAFFSNYQLILLAIGSFIMFIGGVYWALVRYVLQSAFLKLLTIPLGGVYVIAVMFSLFGGYVDGADIYVTLAKIIWAAFVISLPISRWYLARKIPLIEFTRAPI